MGAELIVKAVQVVYSAYAFIGNKRWKQSAEKRFRALEAQLRRAQECNSIIDPQYAESEEFISLAHRVLSAALRDHRELKHRLLAYALTSAAGENASWQYEKKQLLIDLVDQLELYHFVLLDRCLQDACWSNLADVPDIPEPRQNLLISAVQRLVNESLLHSLARSETIRFPTRVGESHFDFRPRDLEEVLQSSTFSITVLGRDLLAFVCFPVQHE